MNSNQLSLMTHLTKKIFIWDKLF